MNRQLFLAAYDVSSGKRLKKALATARQYASGGQKSAYECWLTPTEKRDLLQAMSRVLNSEEDRFALIPLDPRRGVSTLGLAVKPTNPQFFLMV
jgi:CRISPR-associated protein Cas2